MFASCFKALFDLRSPCTPKPATSSPDPSISGLGAWVTRKQGYGFERINPVLHGCTVSICQLHAEEYVCGE